MGKRDDVPSTDKSEIETLRERVRSGRLSERDLALVDRLLGLLLTLISVVEHKNLSIKRLKRLLFGPGSDKRSVPAKAEPASDETATNASSDASASAPAPAEKPKRPGHDRRHIPSHATEATLPSSGDLPCPHQALLMRCHD